MQRDVLIENQGLSDINPLECGSQRCPVGHSFGPAVRDHYLLHFVFSGGGTFYSPNGALYPKPGQIFVIRPGEVCTYTANREAPWHYCWVGFSASLDVAGLLGEDIIDAEDCRSLFLELSACHSLTGGREWLICGKIYELLSFLQRRNNPGTPSNRYVGMAENYIQNNYMQELRVSQIAASLGLDRSYFSQIFRRHTGFSPQQYLVDFRLRRAAELMVSHDLRPGEAAQQCGYGDTANFSHMFRRKYGLSPSAYRIKWGKIHSHKSP